jgi:hypothetical protein
MDYVGMVFRPMGLECLARGILFLYDDAVSILEVIIRPVLPFSDLDFAYAG